MSNIQGVGGVQPPDFSSPKVRRTQQSQEVSPVNDQISISANSTKVAEIALVSELAKASPDIRADLVAKAQEKLASGEYLKPETTRQIAEKILESL